MRSSRLIHSTRRILAENDVTAISSSEKEHFQKLADSWWDETGPQRILHKMNLLRMDFIGGNIKSRLPLNERVTDPEEKVFIPGWSYENLLPEDISNEIGKEINEAIRSKTEQLKLKCLDIGCGGGILSESLARLAMVESVRAIDMTPEVIEVAKQHRELDPILTDKLSYELRSLESIPAKDTYDVVTMMELLEHVEYPADVMKEAMKHVKPGGYLFVSTINRDLVSWFTTIFMGEYVLKIVPVGTHTLSKYIKETELANFIGKSKEFKLVDAKGCAYFPAVGWFFTPTEKIGNYMLAIKRLG